MPTAILWIGGWFIFGTDLGKYGFQMMATLFAAVVLPIVVYQSSHAWVMRRGGIKPATTLVGRLWPASEWRPAHAVVLKRELWPYGRGSTDRVYVETSDGGLSVLGIYNWDGRESVRELEVPVAFECEYVRRPPDDTD